MNAMAKTVGRGGAGNPAGSNRQKIVLIGLCVVLAVVLAIELPNLLHRSSSNSSAPAAVTPTVTAPVASTVPAAATPTFTDTTASASSAAVSNTVKRERAIKQLHARDPFAPLTRATTDQGTSTPPAAAQQVPAAAEAATPATSAQPTTPATTTPVNVVPAPKIVPTAAVVVTNGRRQVIGLHQEFTLGGATFRLASVARDRITVAVDDASFAGGTKTITLRKAKEASFENAATGVSYSVLFRSATDETPTIATATPSATTATAAGTTATTGG